MVKLSFINLKLIGVLCIAFLLSYQHSNAQITTYKGQALFIYNFTKHIKWPSPPIEYTIGVYGNSGLYNELNTSLKGKQINGSAFQIKSIASLSEASQCQIIYLPSSSSHNLKALISKVEKQGVLVITENDLIEEGAGISFLLIDDKIRFKINQAVLSGQGLQVSSGLISLAAK
ncbi:MAG TPA: YfiR family protein [Cytophagales bacterium]|nr:YfiR family protein [Cytophagales bacterium]